MDRAPDPSHALARRRKTIIKIGIAVAVVIGGFMLLSAWISPSVTRSEIRTAIVDSGLVEESFSATGTITPEFEEVISSPIDTRLIQVLKQPGERINKGDQILVFDVSELTLSLNRTEKDLALDINRATQTKLDQEKTLANLKSQYHIKELNVNFLKSKTDQEQKLLDIGASSKDEVEQAKLNQNIAETELEGLAASIKSTEQSLANQLEALDEEIAAAKKERDDIRRQLDILSCKASGPGVVTFAVKDVGATVHRGDILARVSNLNAYRVDCEVSDIHSAQLRTGLPAHILANGVALEGVVSVVNPMIESGIAKFSIRLSDSAQAELRPNLRVDVAVVLRNKGRALRVASGPFLTGDGDQEVFVVDGSSAKRTTARIGVAGFDYVEILDGLHKGDEVIVSDMKDYLHVKEVKIK
jgi:HlyD family secretion protein